MLKQKLKVFMSISIILLYGPSVVAEDTGKDLKAAGANIRIMTEDVDSIYAAGAQVTIEGRADKNIWVAGALVDVDAEAKGDLYAAGSQVNVNGIISGKARIAGADVKIDAEIKEALTAAAASIEVSKNAKLPSQTSLAAALIEFNGVANDDLSLYADEVYFKGQTSGSVTIEGRLVQLDESAIIEGNLIIRSSEDAVISPHAKIKGEMTQLDSKDLETFKDRDDISGGGGILLLATSIFILGLILLIFTRGFVEQGITTLRTQPGHSILWGFIVFFGVPTFVIIAMVTVIGIPIGVAALLLLPFLLILGLTSASLGLSDWILNKGKQSKNTSQRLLLLAAGVIIFVLMGFIPIVGGLIIWFAMLLGLGAASITLGIRLSKSVTAAG